MIIEELQPMKTPDNQPIEQSTSNDINKTEQVQVQVQSPEKPRTIVTEQQQQPPMQETPKPTLVSQPEQDEEEDRETRKVNGKPAADSTEPRKLNASDSEQSDSDVSLPSSKSRIAW